MAIGLYLNPHTRNVKWKFSFVEQMFYSIGRGYKNIRVRLDLFKTSLYTI